MKLSIAMCTYNGAAYLAEQLKSIAAQTRLPDELVVCDDRSTDGRTREIVEAFARIAPFPVRLSVNRKNLGSSGNFEQAIRRCGGDIILLCDQDDVWNQTKLARIEQTFLSAPEIGFVFTNAEVVDEDLRTLSNLSDSFTVEIPAGDPASIFQSLLPGNLITGATLAFRSRLRRFLLPIPRDTILQHDAWIGLIIAAIARVIFLKEPLIKYRQHAGQQIGVSIAGTRNEVRESPLISSVGKHRYPIGEIHAFKTVYARLITKCSRLVGTEELEEIKQWIGRLENERAVLENDAADATERKSWEEMNEYLTQRAIRIEPYIRADLSRLWYRLRPKDIGTVWREIRSDRRHGLQWADQAGEDHS